MAFSTKSISKRLWYMLIGWGSIVVIYVLTSSKDQDAAYMLQPSAVDLWFKFDPHGIWLYLSFFIFVPLGYLLCAKKNLIWLTGAMQLSALGAGLIFILWPTTMVFPEVTQTGVSASMLKLLMHHDSLQNCLPSLHVTLTILVVWALWKPRHPFFNLFFGLWGIAILISILQLHRHQFIDMVCGTILAVCTGLLAHGLIKLASKKTIKQNAI